MAYRKNIIPIIPPAIDSWRRMRGVAASATIIKARAPKRSDQRARLKNTHHRMMTNAQASPPRTLNIMASGKTRGTTNLISTSSTAASTPGQSRSGFRGVGSSV